MTMISEAVKPVDYHPDPSRPTAACSATAIDLFEAGRRRSSETEMTGKEAPIEQGHRRAMYWLISLAVTHIFACRDSLPHEARDDANGSPR